MDVDEEVSGGKALSTWIQAVNIWRLNNTSSKIPRKGTDEYKQIIKIKENLESGKFVPDPKLVKTRSTKPKKSNKITNDRLTRRPDNVSSEPSEKGEIIRRTRALQEEAIQREGIKKAEDALKKSEEQVQKKIDRLQAKLVKTVAKIQSGSGSEEELMEIQKELALLNESQEQEEKRLIQEKKIAEQQAQVAAQQAAVVQQQKEIESQLTSRVPGLIRKLEKREAADIAKINKFLQEKTFPSSKQNTQAFQNRLKKLALEGAVLPVTFKDHAEQLGQLLGVPSLFVEAGTVSGQKVWKNLGTGIVAPPAPAGQKWSQESTDSIPTGTLNITQPEEQSTVTQSATQPATQSATQPSISTQQSVAQSAVQQVVDQGQPLEESNLPPDQPAVNIDDAAPITASGLKKSKTKKYVDAGQLANKLEYMAKTVADEARYGNKDSGSELAVLEPSGGILMPGGRNGVIPDKYKGMIQAKADADANLKNRINPSNSETNKKALELANNMQIEISRLRELANQGIHLISPGTLN